jgi:hypothetical protein
MNLKLVKLQIVLCGLLGSLLITEWAYSAFFGVNPKLSPTSIPSGNGEDAVQSFPELVAVNTNLNELVDRPLFIEGRKPIVETPVDDQKPLETGQIDEWMLIGIFNKNQQSMALFTKKDEAKKFMKIPIQQNISGWLLKEIQSDRVILQQADQQKMIMLRKPRSVTVKPPLPGKPAGHPPKSGKPAVPPPNINPENVNDDSQ